MVNGTTRKQSEPTHVFEKNIGKKVCERGAKKRNKKCKQWQYTTLAYDANKK